MNGLIKTAAVAGFALVTAQAASAAEIEFDFDDLAANSGLASITVGTSVFSVSSVGGAGANLFDTTDPATSDHVNDDDIIPAVQGENGVAGNVLILQTPGNALANDLASGGSITFTLDSGPSLALIGASGIDDDVWTFSTSVGGPLGELVLGADKETGMVDFLPTFLSLGDSFTITFEGSGAIDLLVFDDGVNVVPVPAALPLMLAGLGGFGLLARRRKNRAA